MRENQDNLESNVPLRNLDSDTLVNFSLLYSTARSFECIDYIGNMCVFEETTLDSSRRTTLRQLRPIHQQRLKDHGHMTEIRVVSVPSVGVPH